MDIIIYVICLCTHIGVVHVEGASDSLMYNLILHLSGLVLVKLQKRFLSLFFSAMTKATQLD